MALSRPFVDFIREQQATRGFQPIVLTSDQLAELLMSALTEDRISINQANMRVKREIDQILSRQRLEHL